MSDLSLYNESEVISWFKYLDKLRASGSINMMDAAGRLVGEFGLSIERARFVLSLWMKSFKPKITAEQRARAIFKAHGGGK